MERGIWILGYTWEDEGTRWFGFAGQNFPDFRPLVLQESVMTLEPQSRCFLKFLASFLFLFQRGGRTFNQAFG